MALPGGNPEGDHGKHLLMTTLSSQERDTNELFEEGAEEMNPSFFSADASCSQHRDSRREGTVRGPVSWQIIGRWERPHILK